MTYRAATVATPMLPTPVPLQLPGLVLWYDPSQETAYSHLDEATTLNDWSGLGRPATVEATRVGPIWVGNERNGLAVFQGASGVASETVGLDLQDGDYTLYVACNYLVGTAGNQQRIMHSSLGSPLIAGLDFDTGVGTGDVFSATSTGTTQGTGVDGWQAVSWRWKRSGDPNRVEIRRQLDTVGSVVLIANDNNYPAGGADITRPTWFAQINGGAHYYLGQTGDIILYNQAHDIGTLLLMYDYLAAKWAL